MTENSGPMPKEPESITVGGSKAPLYLPFYYASLSNLWVYFQIDPEKLRPDFASNPMLKGFAPFLFDGNALINFNFQNYTGHGGMMLETCNEVEMNIMTYPTARARDVPMDMTLDDFLKGEDQTKTIGNLRMHVVADNTFAVAAGIALFGEPKFYGQFDYMVPAANNPGVSTWSVKCFVQEDGAAPPPAIPPTNLTTSPALEVFHLSVDTDGQSGFFSNPSPVVEYGVLDQRPIGSNWAMSGTFTSWHPLKHPKKTGHISTGQSNHPMCKDIERLLGAQATAVAVQIFSSPPVAAEPRCYWVDVA